MENERLVMAASISGVEAYAVNRGGGSCHIQRSQEANASDRPMSEHEHMICDLCREVLQLEAEIEWKVEVLTEIFELTKCHKVWNAEAINAEIADKAREGMK